MASRYYPPSQRFYGKYTIGKLFSLPNGTEYIGPYHFFGAQELVMTGAYPRDDSQVLMPYKKQIEHIDIFVYDKLTQLNLKEFKSAKAKRPNPGPNDISNGYMLRYFIKLRNDDTSVPFEIDLKQYEDCIDDDANNIDGFRFQKISLRWKISGPRYDIYLDQEKKQIKTYGVEDTNRRTVFQKNMKMGGLINVLGDLTEHSTYSQIKGESAAGMQTTNLHTDGDGFVLPSGMPYIGYYHIHPTKGAMTGKRHSDKIPHNKLMTAHEFAIASAHGVVDEKGSDGNSGYN